MMNRCFRNSFFLIAAILLAPPAQAQGEIIDQVRIGANAALQWFQELRRPLDQIVAAEKRDQLMEHMSQLSVNLFAIEQDKALLLRLLARPQVDRNQVANNLSRLNQNLGAARATLRRIGPLLRQEHRAGGVGVEAALSDAIVARKGWVEEAQGLLNNPARRASLIKEGTSTLKALRAANVELSRLLTRL